MDSTNQQELARRYGTPLYVLDLDQVLLQVSKLSAFDRVRYAQKAHPGLALLRALAAREELSVDATSGFEVLRALEAGFEPSRIELATDVLDRPTLEIAAAKGIRANLGSLDLIEPWAEATGGREVTLRFNPGFGSGHSHRVTTGGPHSKHGIWHEELPTAYARAERAGVPVTGLHQHIGSGVDLAALEATIDAMGAALAGAPATVTRLSAGGGLPIPYEEGGQEFPVERYAAAWLAARDRWQEQLGRALELEVEPGRFLVAAAGTLLTEVRACKATPAWDWVLVDAGFQTLARPMVYGAFHRIEAVGKEGQPTRPQVVAGPLCEASDVLTQDASGIPRPAPLPDLAPGDLLRVLDTGAYGIAMSSSYNGFPLPAEVLLERGVPRLVRRRTTFEEQLAPELDLPAR